MVCILFKTLLDSQKGLGDRLGAINKFLNNVQTTTQTISDERVRVTEKSANSKFLEEAILGTPGRVRYVDASDALYISGLVPIGMLATISPKRLTDFDSNGLAKPGTDLEGWHIRNGNGGTENVLGRFPMYTDVVGNAGKKEGIKAITIDKNNIAGFSFTITGEIKSALNTPIVAEVPYAMLEKRFGTGAQRDVVVPDGHVSGYKNSKPLNVSHSHTHTLAASHDNPQPAPISIIPEHVKEIPIEFVGF